MWALTGGPEPATPPFLAATPCAALVGLAAAVLIVVGLGATGILPSPVVVRATVVIGHAALIGTAVAWGGDLTASPRSGGLPPWATALGLVGAAAILTGISAWGALAYLAPPLWLALRARHGRLPGLALDGPPPAAGLLAGVAVGVLLGGHVLMSAARTIRYTPSLAADTLLPMLAYDVGANVLSAELFFRGALFNAAQRRWSFATATGVATGAGVVRYLVDPLLPRTVEVALGALFYVSVLSVANCWLLWRFGHLGPGLVSSFLFFAAYRALGIHGRPG